MTSASTSGLSFLKEIRINAIVASTSWLVIPEGNLRFALAVAPGSPAAHSIL
jgi:hypothetical protein